MSLRLLGKNTAIYAIGNVGARAAAFLLIPLYAHSLSLAEFGLLATLQVTIQIMGILTSGGMRTTLLRFTKEYEAKDRLGVLLGTSILVNLLGGLAVATVALTLLIPLFVRILHTSEVYPYVGMVCCAALAQALSAHITSYYRAQHQAIKYMLSGILTAVLLFAATFVLVCVFQLGVVGALAAFILTHTVIALGVSADVLRRTGLSVSWSLLPTLLQFGLPLVFSMCSELIMGAAGVYFLSYFAGLEAVAIYSLGCKLAQVLIITTISPFALAFQPYVYSELDRLGDRKEKIARSLTYVVLAAVFMSFFLVVATRIALPWIAPPEYASAFYVVLLLVPGFTFVGVYYFGETLLNATKKTRTVGLTAALIATFSVLLNYVLVRNFHWFGAAIALDVSFILVGCALAAIGMRKFPIPLEWKRIGVLGGMLLLLLTTAYALRNLPIASFAITSVLVGTLSVLLLLHYSFFHEDEKLVVGRLVARLR